MTDVVITGASGFIGVQLSQHLTKEGFNVIPISLRNNTWRSQIPSTTKIIIHLAGINNTSGGKNKTEDYFLINTKLSEDLFDFFNQSEIPKFIYFSTVKAVSESIGDEILTEDYPASPSSPYGQSKRNAEEYLLLKEKKEKKCYILRPCMIHGAGNKGTLKMLLNFVQKRIPYPLAAFTNQRSFLSIENLNFLIHQLCTQNIASGIYNVADSEYLSTTDLVKIINECIGKKPIMWSLNKKNITFIAKLGTKLSLPFNTNTLKKLTESYQVSNQKIVGTLEVKLPVNAADGIRSTINSMIK